MKNAVLGIHWMIATPFTRLKPLVILSALGLLTHVQVTQAQGSFISYPDCKPHVPTINPTWRWSDSNCWITVVNGTDVYRLPQSGDSAGIRLNNPFTLDVSTPSLFSLTIAGPASFSQPGSTLRTLTEFVFSQFNQSGGRNEATALLMGGTYNLQGGTLSVSSERVVQLPPLGTTAILNQSDGTNIAGNLLIDDDGTYNLNGGHLTAATEVIGGHGVGYLNQRGGTSIISGQMLLGQSVIKQTGGTNTVGGDLTLAEKSNASYTLSGDMAVSLHVRGDENLGTEDASQMEFVQTGGTHKVDGNLNLGGTPHLFSPPQPFAGRGSYDLDAGSLSVGGTEMIAFVNGQFLQTGGTNTANSLVVEGSYTLEQPARAPATATISIATDEVIETPALFSSVNHPTTFLQDGGTHSVAGTLTVSDSSSYKLDDGTLTAGQIVNKSGGRFEYYGGTLTGNFMNESGGYFLISGSGIRAVNGDLTNSGKIEVTAQQVDFYNVSLSKGVFKVDPSKVQFQNLDVAAPAYITGTAGDVFVITGNFQDLSTQATLWTTGAAQLDFAGGGTHIFDLAGRTGAGFSDNFAWGSLVIDAGNSVDLGMGSGNALYVGSITGLQISGNTITNLDGAPGLIIYYDPASNPLLHGSYNLTGGGELIAASGGAISTPEPSTVLLFVGGLGSLFACRKWRVMLVLRHSASIPWSL